MIARYRNQQLQLEHDHMLMVFNDLANIAQAKTLLGLCKQQISHPDKIVIYRGTGTYIMEFKVTKASTGFTRGSMIDLENFHTVLIDELPNLSL